MDQGFWLGLSGINLFILEELEKEIIEANLEIL